MRVSSAVGEVPGDRGGMLGPFPWSLHPQDGSLAWVPLTSLPGSSPGLGLVTLGCGPLFSLARPCQASLSPCLG